MQILGAILSMFSRGDFVIIDPKYFSAKDSDNHFGD